MRMPSDDEVRAALQRSRPNRTLEAVGCVAVSGCAAAGGLLGLLAFDWLGGPEGIVAGQAPPRAFMLIPAGALAGFTAGVLAFQLVRVLIRCRTRPAPPRQAPAAEPGAAADRAGGG